MEWQIVELGVVDWCVHVSDTELAELEEPHPSILPLRQNLINFVNFIIIFL